MGYSEVIYGEVFKDRDAGDFPMSLGIELTNHCNLRCPMCPREIAERGYGNMDWELFTSIADQCSGRERLLVTPSGFGESLIHPRFAEMMHYLHEHDVSLVMLITNATYFTPENVHDIIDAQVPFLNVSLDGTKKEAYEAIRVNATLEEVEEGVERLFRLRKERWPTLPHIILRMIVMDETRADVDAFKARWEPFLEEGDEIAFSSYQTWSGTVEDKRTSEPEGFREVLEIEKREGKRPPCRMLFKTMQVYYDGRTTPCCYDYDCSMEIGNARDESIEAMWNSERARHFRQLHEDGRYEEIDICRNCQEYVP